MENRGRNLKKDSKTPRDFGIMEVERHLHYSKQRGLSSERYDTEENSKVQPQACW
jgi:hypothetical protein